MIHSQAVNDYYIDSNELRILAQRLHHCFNEVFEMSLNTSLATGKIQAQSGEGEVYEVVAAKIEDIAKKLRMYIHELITEANILTKYSLENKQTSALLEQFQQSIPTIHGDNNKVAVNQAIARLKGHVDKSINKAIDHLKEVEERKLRLLQLNEQTWLTLGQLRVQLSQNESETNLQHIVTNFDRLGEKIATYLNEIDVKIQKLKKFLMTSSNGERT